jgi:hypothetical protein
MPRANRFFFTWLSMAHYTPLSQIKSFYSNLLVIVNAGLAGYSRQRGVMGYVY